MSNRNKCPNCGNEFHDQRMLREIEARKQIIDICDEAGIGPVATPASIAGDDAVDRVRRLADAKIAIEKQWKACADRLTDLLHAPDRHATVEFSQNLPNWSSPTTAIATTQNGRTLMDAVLETERILAGFFTDVGNQDSYEIGSDWALMRITKAREALADRPIPPVPPPADDAHVAPGCQLFSDPQKPKEPDQRAIHVNGKQLICPSPITALNLKVLAGYGSEKVVYRESKEGPGKDQYFNDVDSIRLIDGDEFIICPDGYPK